MWCVPVAVDKHVPLNFWFVYVVFCCCCSVYYARKQKFRSAPKSIAMSNPRLVMFAKAMLRVDPCFTVTAVKPGVAGNAAISAALKAAGKDGEVAAVAAFVKDLNGDLDELARLFPTRVTVREEAA